MNNRSADDSDFVDNIYIAAPCTVGWENMDGDERVRFCNLCQLNVYNTSQLSRVELENLIVETEGRFCARLYRRSDGTIITDDCPVGLRKLRDASRRVAHVVAAVCAFFVAQTMALCQGCKSQAPSAGNHGKIQSQAKGKAATGTGSGKSNGQDGLKNSNGIQIVDGRISVHDYKKPPAAPSNIVLPPFDRGYIERTLQAISAQWATKHKGKGPILNVMLDEHGHVQSVKVLQAADVVSSTEEAVKMVKSMKHEAPPAVPKGSFSQEFTVDLYSIPPIPNKRVEPAGSKQAK